MSGPSNNDLFMRLEENTLMQVMVKKEQYGTTSYRRTDDGRKHILVAFDKRPDSEDVIYLYRAYSTISSHTLDRNYKPRIYWTDNESAAISEYVGTFPGHA